MLRAKLRRDIRACLKGKPVARPEGSRERPVPTYGGDTVVRVPKHNQDDRALMARVQEQIAEIYFAADRLVGQARVDLIRRGISERFPA